MFKYKRKEAIMKFLANVLSIIGLGAASTGSQACVFFYIDEPECPESLIK